MSHTKLSLSLSLLSPTSSRALSFPYFLFLGLEKKTQESALENNHKKSQSNRVTWTSLSLVSLLGNLLGGTTWKTEKSKFGDVITIIVVVVVTITISSRSILACRLAAYPTSRSFVEEIDNELLSSRRRIRTGSIAGYERTLLFPNCWTALPTCPCSRPPS